MSKTRRNLLLGVVAALVVATVLWGALRAAFQETATIARTDYQQSVPAQGHIDTRNYIPLRAPDSPLGRQIVFLFPEGQPVKKGKIVARFDSSEVEDKIESLEEEIQIRETAIEEKIAEWEIRSERLDTIIFKLDEELKMNTILVQTSKFDSQLKQDAQQVRHNGTQRTISSLKKLRQRFDIWRDGGIAHQNRKIQACRDGIAKQQALLEHYIIYAPFDTITRYPKIRITKIYRQPEPGDELVRLQEFGQLPDYNSKCLNLFVPEKQLESVEVGMQVEFTTQSAANIILHGTVTSKATFASKNHSRPGRPHYLVQADIDPAQTDAPSLIPGANISAKILTALHPNVFPVPRDLVDAAGEKLSLHTENGKKITLDLSSTPRSANHYLIPADGQHTLTLLAKAPIEGNEP